MSIEAVALVSKVEVIQKSEQQKKAETYAELGRKFFESKDYVKSFEYFDLSNRSYMLGWVQTYKGISMVMTNNQEGLNHFVNGLTLMKSERNSKKTAQNIQDVLSLLLAHNSSPSEIKSMKEIIEIEFDLKPTRYDFIGLKAEFKTTSHDFGKISIGAPANCSFELINIGAEPVRIQEVVSSSSSVKVDFDRNEVNSGEKTNIILSYDTNRTGPIKRSVLVKTNAGDFTLTIQGFVQ